jgi:hypothetical protein
MYWRPIKLIIKIVIIKLIENEDCLSSHMIWRDTYKESNLYVSNLYVIN